MLNYLAWSSGGVMISAVTEKPYEQEIETIVPNSIMKKIVLLSNGGDCYIRNQMVIWNEPSPPRLFKRSTI